jgi:hypothetical protein
MGWPSIASDGSVVSFETESAFPVPGHVAGTLDVFVWNRATAAFELVVASIEWCTGRWLLVLRLDLGRRALRRVQQLRVEPGPGRSRRKPDWFVRDLRRHETSMLPIPYGSYVQEISADGRYVLFTQYTTVTPMNLYLLDRLTGSTEVVTTDLGGAPANALTNVGVDEPDARFVAFHCAANDLVVGDTNGVDDVFVADRGPHVPSFEVSCAASAPAPCPCGNNGSPQSGCGNHLYRGRPAALVATARRESATTPSSSTRAT